MKTTCRPERRRAMIPMVLLLGLAACADDDTAARAAAPSDEPEAIGWLRPIAPGSEPRSEPRFRFEAGRRERATLRIHSSFAPAGGERTDERLELELALSYPDATHLALEVRGATTTAPDIPAIGTTVGTTASSVFHPNGATDAPIVRPAPGADPRAAEYVRGALVQALPGLLPALPDTAIGAGARWGGDGLTYTLVSLNANRIVVERRGGLDREERLPDGRRIEVEEEQIYRIDAPFDGVARRLEADLVTRGSEGTRRRTELRFEVHPDS